MRAKFRCRVPSLPWPIAIISVAARAYISWFLCISQNNGRLGRSIPMTTNKQAHSKSDINIDFPASPARGRGQLPVACKMQLARGFRRYESPDRRSTLVCSSASSSAPHASTLSSPMLQSTAPALSHRAFRAPVHSNHGLVSLPVPVCRGARVADCRRFGGVQKISPPPVTLPFSLFFLLEAQQRWTTYSFASTTAL